MRIERRNGRYYFIGFSPPAPELLEQIKHRIGPGEAAIEISRPMLEAFIREQRWWRRALRRIRYG